jgi:DNA-binding GntR family transcriptional regulator
VLRRVEDPLDRALLHQLAVTHDHDVRQPVKRLLLVQEEHRRVLDAIIRRDAATAARAMAEHIENARRRMFEGAAPEGE